MTHSSATCQHAVCLSEDEFLLRCSTFTCCQSSTIWWWWCRALVYLLRSSQGSCPRSSSSGEVLQWPQVMRVWGSAQSSVVQRSHCWIFLCEICLHATPERGTRKTTTSPSLRSASFCQPVSVSTSSPAYSSTAPAPSITPHHQTIFSCSFFFFLLFCAQLIGFSKQTLS